MIETCCVMRFGLLACGMWAIEWQLNLLEDETFAKKRKSEGKRGCQRNKEFGPEKLVLNDITKSTKRSTASDERVKDLEDNRC